MSPTIEIGKPLAELKADRAADVDRWREQQCTPVTHNGARYDADAVSQARIAAMAAAIANGAVTGNITWRDADNITQTLSPAEFKAMATAVMISVQTVFNTSFTLKDQINAATTAAEVRAVKWP